MSQWQNNAPPPPTYNAYDRFQPFDDTASSAQTNLVLGMEQDLTAIQNADIMMSLFGGDMMTPFSEDVSMTMDSINNNDNEGIKNTLQTATTDIEGVDGMAITSDNPIVANSGADNVPGGGPSPSGGPPLPIATAQVQNISNGGLTEFTKRRNWPAKVVEELKDVVQILDANGRIKYISSNIHDIAGYTIDDVRDIFMKDIIHPDDQGIFVTELNESIASGNPMRLFYRFRKKDGKYIMFEAIGHAHIAAAKFAPNPSNQSPFCQAVFVMARIYPTKNASLLDSFLEHKLENERLKRRIAELRKEEEFDTDDMERIAYSQTETSEISYSDITAPSIALQLHKTASSSELQNTQFSTKALTRENLEGSSSTTRTDSLGDKMARYEGASHGDTIEMLTGLRYAEGERSRGITTGNTSPALIKGDAGIAMPKDPDSRSTDKKKKKIKTAEEYVCTDCGKF